jgi:hypothetical protein
VKFDRTSVEVLHDHKRILEGVRNERNGLWTVDLQANNSHTDKDEITKPNLKSEQAHSVYECTNKRDLVQFLHAASFRPEQDTWLKAIRAGHVATWPGLTEDLVCKHLPKEIATVKCHLSQRRKKEVYYNNRQQTCARRNRTGRYHAGGGARKKSPSICSDGRCGKSI